MSTTIRVQESHSRNPHDWKTVKLPGGRTAFVADGKGVFFRMGVLLNFLVENSRSGSEAMSTFLQTQGKGYRQTDVSQPIKQMLKAKIIRSHGKGRGTTYSVTNNGMRIWLAVKVEWV
jgi:hypothetical protein